MRNNGYYFGAGGFKLGDRVEVMTTRHRGIIMSEIIHLSGCNSYQVLLPNVLKLDKAAIKNYDHLILRKLKAHEAVFGKEDNLTDETIFSPKGTDVNAEWIKAAVLEMKEPIPEVDEAIGVDEIKIQPGTEVWHKVYNIPMLVIFICRNLYSKELEYGLLYMANDREITVFSGAYALIPMEQRVEVYADSDGKVGPVFDEFYPDLGSKLLLEDFERFSDIKRCGVE